MNEIIETLEKQWPAAALELRAQQRNFERECTDADKICAALGLDVVHTRTEGGALHLPRILNRIKSLLAARAAAGEGA